MKKSTLLFLAFALLLPAAVRAQTCITPQFLSGFENEPHDPVRSIPLHGSDGALYFTTWKGGWADDGALVKYAPDGTRTNLVNFDRLNAERTPKAEPIGHSPETGVIEGPDGALYGTTQAGGNSTIGVSTVFRCTKAGVYTTLGYLPGGSAVTPSRLTLGNDGNFYGVTTVGGSGNGSIFRVAPNAPGNYTACTISTITQFTGPAASITATEGRYPRGPLAQRLDGSTYAMYGVVAESGVAPSVTGRVFRFTIPAGPGTISPQSIGRLTSVGTLPEAGLTTGANGLIYGTVSRSVGGSGSGGVFAIDKDRLILAIHDFGTDGGALGTTPNTPVLYGSDDYLYGGNSGNSGRLWRMDSEGGDASRILGFTGGVGGDGEDATGLVQRPDGSIWGLTAAGGSDGRGTLFSITGNGRPWVHTVAWHMGLRPAASDGSLPSAGLVSDGSLLYGTTETGGSLVNNGNGYGTIYSYNPFTNVRTTLFAFTGQTGALGHWPRATLLRRPDGWFYGTTSAGGQAPFPGGTVFKWKPAAGSTPQQFVTLGQFNRYANGAYLAGTMPESALCDFGHGWLYGTTKEGGVGNRGTIYRVSGVTGEVQSIVAFSGTGGAVPGGEPVAGLTKHGSLLWGVTTAGSAGSGNLGTLFSFDPVSGAFISRFDFASFGANSIFGYSPWSTLLSHNGLLYGTCKFGASGGGGALWAWNPASGSMSLVRAFTNSGSTRPPAYPLAGLTPGSDGALYGTTSESFTNGQPGNYGNIYRIGKDGGYSLTGTFTGYPAPLTPSLPGANPQHHSLCMGPDGMLYGTTSNGATGYGGIFRINPGPVVTTRTPRALTSTSVSAGGFVTPNGFSVTRSVEYLTTAALSRGEPPSTLSVFSLPVSSPGSYTLTITGLTPNVDYAFRAVANSLECGDARGEWVIFRITNRSLWLNEKFGTNASVDAIGGLYADPDADGSPNLLEWIENTNPTKADPPDRIKINVVDGPVPYLSTEIKVDIARVTDGDETLFVEHSRDMADWISRDYQFLDGIPYTAPSTFWVFVSDEERPYRRFFRVRAGITGTERIPSLFNTGVNDARQVVPDNYVDIHWDAGAYIGGAWQEYGFAYHRNSQYGWPIAPAGPWMGDNTKSGWLGYSPTFAGGSGNTYVYLTKFNIPWGVDPRTVAISGRITSDDGMYRMALNGFANATGITGDGNYTALGPEWFITRGFQTGDNTLEFHVQDLGAPSGFRAELSGTWQRAGRVAIPDLMNSGCTTLDAAPIAVNGQTVTGMKVLFPGSTTPVTPVAATSGGGWPVTAGAWSLETSSSTWIKPDNSVSHPAGTYIFTREFDLTGLDPETLEIEGRVAADDTVEVWLNNAVKLQVTGVTYNGWAKFALWPTHRYLLQSGLNKLDFRVTNNPAAGNNPSGLRYEFLHAAAIPLPQ